ncbi:3-hydroxyacyl-CoA dehydrogenase [Alteromonas sp. M12]|uniref:3-hydroxyacyl-CoA dehydrogenase n=1 Tax=Alteromonas sp. M12 TaxID=3135644 RepID=UPI00319E27E1
MVNEKKQVVGVIGAGTMGRGIVQLFAQNGHQVHLYDSAQEAVLSAMSSILQMIDKLANKGRIEQSTATIAKNNLNHAEHIKDLAVCDIVIEAIVENIDIKRSVFQQLEEVVSANCILASNTSSLLIADISAACTLPNRVVGMHFFNPVPLMKLVEIISSVRTSENTLITAQNLINSVGHVAVLAKDQPGFLVNHAGRGLYTEGLRILEEQVASVADIDQVLREACGFKMGPFELLDLTGLDVSGKVMESIYQQFQQEAMFRPSTLVPPRIAANLLGRKTGEGWYQYEDGKKVEDKLSSLPVLSESLSIWIDPDADEYADLRDLFSEAGISVVTEAKQDSILVIQPWGKDVSQVCEDKGLDATRVVAIDPLFKESKRRTIMSTMIVQPEYIANIHASLVRSGHSVTVIKDSPGFISQRVLAVIINIASNIAQRGVASVTDIDIAVKFGLGYPHGPLSWGDKVGTQNIVKILDGLFEVTRDPRYRTSMWLRRRAQLNVSLLTED